MKHLSVLYLLSIILCSTFAHSKEQMVDPSWLRLSTECQNLHNEFSFDSAHAPATQSHYDKPLSKIDTILTDMVDKGILQAQTIELKAFNSAEEEHFEDLIQVVDKIALKYGVFVALEMCDLGVRFRTTTFSDEAPFTLTLRLPKEDLDLFIKRAKALDLLKN